MYGLQTQRQGIEYLPLSGCALAPLGRDCRGGRLGAWLAHLFWRGDGQDARLLRASGVPVALVQRLQPDCAEAYACGACRDDERSARAQQQQPFRHDGVVPHNRTRRAEAHHRLQHLPSGEIRQLRTRQLLRGGKARLARCPLGGGFAKGLRCRHKNSGAVRSYYYGIEIKAGEGYGY